MILGLINLERDVFFAAHTLLGTVLFGAAQFETFCE